MIEWEEQSLSRFHDRKSFDCGDSDLNTYLHQYARQNHESGVSRTYIVVPPTETSFVLGYYSLSPASIGAERVPEDLRKVIARYDAPVFRLGRLAVDSRMQGQKLGGQLLLLAGRRCVLAAREVGGVAMLIDAKNERVGNWYERFGAIPLRDSPLTLVMRLGTLEKQLTEIGWL